MDQFVMFDTAWAGQLPGPISAETLKHYRLSDWDFTRLAVVVYRDNVGTT